MKKTYLLIAASVLFSLPSCSKKDVFQERIDDVNKGLFSILGSKPKDIYRCLGLYGGTKTVSSDDGKEMGFEYKEKRSDGVDVYTYGVKNGLETEFYYRNDAAVGFKTRDPEFGFSYFGYTIGYPIWSHLENTPAFQTPSIREDTIRMLSVKNAKKTLGTGIQNTTHGTLQHFRTNFTWNLVGPRCIR